MRRFVVLISAIFLLDTSFFAAVTPLLPYYTEHEGFTKVSAGLLAGAYPAGTLAASLPAAMLAPRVGHRALVAVGLAILAAASIAFGLAHGLALLAAARFAQGVGGALSWTGGMSWLSAAAPADGRGRVAGTAMAATTAGMLLGPVLGVVAGAAGTAATFGLIGVLAIVLLALVVATPAHEVLARPERGDLRTTATQSAIALRAAATQPAIALGLWIFVCAALCVGVVNVLLPLRLDRAGASAGVVALVFLLGAAIEIVVSVYVGRRIDRAGWRGVTRFGLVGAGASVVAAAVPTTVLPLVVIGIACLPLIGCLWTPGLVLLGTGSGAADIDHAYAYALMNLVWAAALAAATAGGAVLAHATADVVPSLIVGTMAILTALVLTGARSLGRALPAFALRR